ncbi:unnamed protein product [Lactuca saligna]|uniref:At2g35280-like TPR domain-containing protein n=1 Tax=Lactuca saligna TaxID=75948 RepID=A0AA35Y870_LACSI|nr:unnamed protein product [Lactuca saligna]
MDAIWAIGQHGCCLWCPWLTYGPFVNMVVAYGVLGGHTGNWSTWLFLMVSIFDIWMTYGPLVNMLHFRVCSDQKHTIVNKCIEMRNPNILFRNGLMKLFFLEAEYEGKTMLEEASALGHLDSTFVLGMMLMGEGRHGKHEALNMLNNAYRRAKGKWNLRETCSKVHLHLNREGRKHV